MSEGKRATPDYPIQEVISKRWSPYVFDERPVAEEDLLSLFEAARWAASSYNEQPWRYIVATRREHEEFARLLSCLVEPNQAWAKHAPVLALGVVSLRFSKNDKPNKAAHHDLGLASGSLTFEATARGLFVHQMIGIIPERAKELYQIPDGFEALTALALGYPGTGSGDLAERDQAVRSRRPVSDFVFAGGFGRAFVS